MIRYYLAAAALKFFSLNRGTKRLYRDVLGNRFGAKRREKQGLTQAYIERAALLLNLCKKHNAVGDVMHILEVGTGWTHFFAMFLRLFYDMRVTVVDIWDNRQFAPFHRTFAQLDGVLDMSFDLTDDERKRAHGVLKRIAEARSFEEVYDCLGFDYVIDGILDTLPSDTYDLIFSFHVIEHVFSRDVPRHVGNMARVLKPGGVQIHQIGIDDHLAHYDKSASMKQYLQYSNLRWRLCFENEVQYFNRLQRSEWLKLFADSRMVLEEELRETCDVSQMKVHRDFARLDRDDSPCIMLTLVLRKPWDAGNQSRRHGTRGSTGCVT